MEESNCVFNGLFIKYVPNLNLITKNKEASLVVSRLEYWFQSYKKGFYKFMEPCSNPLYRPGDSWEEELGFTRRVFNRAFSYIGIKYKSKSLFLKAKDPFQGKLYASYYDRKTNRTYFIRNHKTANSLLKKIFNRKISKEESQKNRDLSCRYRNDQKSRSFTRACQVSSLQRNTSSVLKSLKPHGEGLESKVKKNTDEMKNIWKEEIGGEGLPKSLVPLSRRLYEALQTFFQESLEKWREYCRKIASSKFLMGEKTKFRAWISWVIKGDVFERIMAGDFDIGDRVPRKVQEQRALKKLQLERKREKEAQLEREKQENEKSRRKKTVIWIESLNPDEKEKLKKSFSEELLRESSELAKNSVSMVNEFKEKGWKGFFMEEFFHEWVGERLAFEKPFDLK